MLGAIALLISKLETVLSTKFISFILNKIPSIYKRIFNKESKNTPSGPEVNSELHAVREAGLKSTSYFLKLILASPDTIATNPQPDLLKSDLRELIKYVDKEISRKDSNAFTRRPNTAHRPLATYFAHADLSSNTPIKQLAFRSEIAQLLEELRSTKEIKNHISKHVTKLLSQHKVKHHHQLFNWYDLKCFYLKESANNTSPFPYSALALSITQNGETLLPETKDKQAYVFSSIALRAQLTDSRAMLDFINKQALAEYNKKVTRISSSQENYEPKIWSEIFSDTDYLAQQQYVSSISEDAEDISNTVIQKLIPGPKKIWLVGEAGVGKSTALYNIFFRILREDAISNTPLLIQPQEFDHTDIEAFKTSTNISKDLLIRWLLNRNMIYPSQHSPRLDAEFQAAQLDVTVDDVLRDIIDRIRSGKVIIMIDSYDELTRMTFQIEIFRSVFNNSKAYVCASRPETYFNKIEDIHTRIIFQSPWALPDIKKYFSQKGLAPSLSSKLIEHIRANQESHWLRNPRYLNLVLESIALLKNADGSLPDEELDRLLNQGELGFFNQLFKITIGRVNRYLRPLGKSIEEAKIEKILTTIAISQLNTGSYPLKQKREKKSPLLWRALLNESTLLRVRNPTSDSKYKTLTLTSHNLIDFYISDDILRLILNPSSKTTNILFHPVWTEHLLKYIVSRINRKIMSRTLSFDQLETLLWKAIERHTATGASGLESATEYQTSFFYINVVQLIVRLKRITKWEYQQKPDFTATVSSVEQTKGLNLSTGNYSTSDWKGCNFTNTNFSSASLANSTFEGCTFHNTILSNANAERSSFINCHFFSENLDKHYIDFRIKGAQFKTCTFGPDRIPLTGRWLKSQGAVDYGSRYSSQFGKDFFQKQDLFLGKGLKLAETYYTQHLIKPTIKAIELSSQNEPIVLVDLMAGGRNDRILDLYNTSHNLKIIAIDRDTRQFISMHTELGEKIKIVNKTIQGAFGLPEVIRLNRLPDSEARVVQASGRSISSQADIIIAKKALHEIDLEEQQELIQECYQSLSPGGSFILFADSPIKTSSQASTQIRANRNFLAANYHNVNSIRQYVSSLEFSSSNDSISEFSNLWINLKDWANENRSELENRYFSATNELVGWAKTAGFKLADHPKRFSYDLVDKVFNETAFNRIGSILDKTGGSISSPFDQSKVKELLSGNEKQKVFHHFAALHLRANAYSPGDGTYSDLGLAVNSTQKKLMPIFKQLNPEFDLNSIPYPEGLSFQFQVHVFKFNKPSES